MISFNYSFDNNTDYNNINSMFMESLPCARLFHIQEIYNVINNSIVEVSINQLFNEE